MNAIALRSLNLFLRTWGAQLREEQAMVSEFQDTALGMQAQVDEFVEQYAESIKRVIDRECSDVKKHEQDLVENAEALAWHEESVVAELRRELQQARLQVSCGSGLAEQAAETVGVCSYGALARVPWDIEDEGGFRSISGELSCLRVFYASCA